MKSGLAFVAPALALFLAVSVIYTDWAHFSGKAANGSRSFAAQPERLIESEPVAPRAVVPRVSVPWAAASVASPVASQPPSSLAKKQESSSDHGGPKAASEEPKRMSSADYREYVNTAFESQHVDPTWSRKASLEVRTTLLPLLETNVSRATPVDCREDLCRFEVRNRDAAAYDKAVHATTKQTFWDGAMMLSRSATDPTTLVVYLAKKDNPTPFPLPNQGS